MMEYDLIVTNAAATIQSLAPAGDTVPQNAAYVQIFNPSSTASIAFSINSSTPAVNGLGITLGPLGSETFDNPAGTTFPIGALKFISSISSQPVTVFWM